MSISLAAATSQQSCDAISLRASPHATLSAHIASCEHLALVQAEPSALIQQQGLFLFGIPFCKAGKTADKRRVPYVHKLRLSPLRRKHWCPASLNIRDEFLFYGAESKQQLLQEALMDAEDRQKAEAAAKRAAKRERLSKQKAEALRVQEEKAAAEAAEAAAGQAADRADATEAEEVSLCACAAAGACVDGSKSFHKIPVLSGTWR